MSRKRIFVTGATGNVGRVVVSRLAEQGHDVTAGVRDTERARATLAEPVHLCRFDFESPVIPGTDYNAVFLVRPPQLADPKPFAAFVQTLPPRCRVVFLSVFGADRRRYLPHAKIERVIQRSGRPHVFLRPTYFMENLLTTLWPELEQNRRIFLPAGRLSFNWIAVSDIAEAAARALVCDEPPSALEISSRENHTFEDVLALINRRCGTTYRYESPFVAAYVVNCLRSGTALSFVAIMLLLHFLPRFSRQPDYSPEALEAFIGRRATSLQAFVETHRERFSAPFAD